MKIVFLHPDLGIGGAERLVVDAALALKSKGHDVQFVTNHHDVNHCFPETRDGTFPITVVGDWIPRKCLGLFHALFAYIRMMYAAFWLVFQSGIKHDVVFCDQISACIPVLYFGEARILFYCHFPDQLLSYKTSLLKKLYRFPLDLLEELTTGMADMILVNSRFTELVFRKTFKRLEKVEVSVLYPSLHTASFDRPLAGFIGDIPSFKDASSVFLSINRFERKKNLSLALEALKHLQDMLEEKARPSVGLILAGGYDPNLPENIQHLEELQKKARELGITEFVHFIRSPSEEKKIHLLHSCTAVIYTPENEHFGIVPLEAMYMRRPVIATNTGGPLETVLHEQTGFLCKPSPRDFATAMLKYVKDHSLAREMGALGHEHVVKNFSFQRFTERLSQFVEGVKPPERKSGLLLIGLALLMLSLTFLSVVHISLTIIPLILDVLHYIFHIFSNCLKLLLATLHKIIYSSYIFVF